MLTGAVSDSRIEGPSEKMLEIHDTRSQLSFHRKTGGTVSSFPSNYWIIWRDTLMSWHSDLVRSLQWKNRILRRRTLLLVERVLVSLTVGIQHSAVSSGFVSGFTTPSRYVSQGWIPPLPFYKWRNLNGDEPKCCHLLTFLRLPDRLLLKVCSKLHGYTIV